MRPPSQLRSMLRLVARGVRARGAPPAWDASVPRRRVAVERSGIRVNPAQLHAYVRATGGEGIATFRGAGAVAPPFYPATWEVALALEMLAGLDTPLPLGPMVHVASDVVWARAIPPGDVLRCRVELEGVERVRRGLRIAVLARNWLAGGQLCCQSTSTFLLRLRPRDGDGGGDDVARVDARAPLGGWTELARWALPGDAGRRYARASGDYNPIHLWPWTARPFGFRAPILHGFATAARAAHGIIEQRLRGDARALRRMRIAFRAPLPLPSTAVLLVCGEGGDRWFRVAAADGSTVHAEGTYGGAGSG